MLTPLVRGKNTGGNFDILPPPAEGEFHPAPRSPRHEDAYRRYRDNYAFQIDAHDRDFAGSGAAPTPRSTLDSRADHLVGRRVASQLRRVLS